MSSFVPRGKKFQPRIPREQLLELTTQELQEKGVEHNSQAKLMAEIAQEIYTTDEPIFAQLRGRAFVRNTEAWNRVYSLVNNYLRNYEMNNTIETIETELATARAIKHNKAVDKKDAFEKILQTIKPKQKPFKERVKEWKAEDEKLNPKPAFVRPTMKEMKQSNNVGHVQFPKKSSIATTPIKTSKPASSSSSSGQSSQQSSPNAKPIPQKVQPIEKKQPEKVEPAPKKEPTQVQPKPQPKVQSKPISQLQKLQQQSNEQQFFTIQEEDETPAESPKQQPLQVIPESSENNDFDVDFESSEHSDDIKEIPTKPAPQKTEDPVKTKEEKPQKETALPLSKQAPTTFAKKSLLNYEEPEDDVNLDFTSDDDFITESSAVKNEKSNATASMTDSFAKESFVEDSTVKVESSKQSSDFDESSKVNVVATESSSNVDFIEESSKANVVQTDSDNDVEVIEDSSKVDVQQSSNEFIEIDSDWDS